MDDRRAGVTFQPLGKFARVCAGAFLAGTTLCAHGASFGAHDFTMNNNDPPARLFPRQIFRMEGTVLPEKEGLRRSAAPVRAIRLLG